jgi:hypothetical protein
VALAVTPEQVAAFAPGAPAVSEDQILEALDWAELLLQHAHVELQPGTPQERAARRAVMNYALAVASESKASTTRVTVAGAATKKIKVGKIEIEKVAAQGGESVAEGLSTSAQDYHERAWQALYAAGVPRPRPAVGASR